MHFLIVSTALNSTRCFTVFVVKKTSYINTVIVSSNTVDVSNFIACALLKAVFIDIRYSCDHLAV